MEFSFSNSVDFPTKYFIGMIRIEYAQHDYRFSGVSTSRDRELVLQFSDILLRTLAVEDNFPKVVSFFVRGVHDANFNIKFGNRSQAKWFVEHKVKIGALLIYAISTQKNLFRPLL